MPRIALGSILLLLALPLASAAPSLEHRIPRDDRGPLQQEALLLLELLQNYHYASRPFHELDAHEFLDRYLAALDPERLILTASDVEFVHRRFDRNLKTVYLFKGDLRPAFEIYDLFAERARARYRWVEKRLAQDFDLAQNDRLTADRAQADWPADATAADQLWEQWLRASLVGDLVAGRSREAALVWLREAYAKSQTRLAGMDPLAVREQFLTTLLEFFDPHSGYFSRSNADEFDIEMAGAVAGVGLDLQVVDGHFLVKAIHPGGPGDLQGTLHPGDEILAVAAGDAPAQPLAGKRLREVVRLIRGQPGSPLTLTVRAAEPSAPPRAVALTRARVDLPDNHARGYLIQVPTDTATVPVALIQLPAFYGSEEKEGVTVSMASEVRELLQQFAAQGARGLVLDLRENGGGLMREAARLGGLFLAGGPIVFLPGAEGPAEILGDDDPAVSFTGPLVILTSRRSASASELFAGAMQCYQRALVVGDDTTFGKGTMQTYIDLRQIARTSPALQKLGGVARVTRQLYYLPDGRSPQLAGVASDIVLPCFHPPQQRQEKDLPHALPTSTRPPPAPLPAQPPEVARLTPELRTLLTEKTHGRLAQLPEFALHHRRLDFFRELYATTDLPLQLEARQRQQASQDQLRNTLRDERRRLGEQVGYAATKVDLATVAAAAQVHQQALRLRRGTDGAPCAGRFYREVFYYETTPGGLIRTIAVDELDLAACRAAAPQLAAAWTAATARPLAPEAVTAFLADVGRQRDHPLPGRTTAALLRRHLDAPIDDAVLARGLTAFFKAAIEIDGSLLQDLPTLDVALRESLRLALDWSNAMPAHAANSPLEPQKP